MRARAQRASRMNSRSGAVALEFALAAPVLLTLVSGIADYGWYLSRESEIVECVRDAARVGISADDGEDPEAIAEARAAEALLVLGLDPDLATIDAQTSVDATLGETVLTVTVTVPYTAPVGLLPAPAALASRVTMLVPA